MKANLVRAFGTVLVFTAACGSGSAAPIADGPVKVGVMAGNNQTVPAARSARLPKNVGVQAVRLPNGSVALRVLDAMLPPKAYAQTGVVSVPGVVACPDSPDPKHALIPEVLCTATGADGIAWFTFHSDSIAGVSKALVKATVNQVTVITDSVLATILPGAASPTYRTSNIPIANFPAIMPAGSVVDQFGNALPFRIVSDGRIVVQGDTVGTVAARTIVAAPANTPSSGYVVELQGANDVLLGRARYLTASGQLQQWTAAGVSLTP
jgi:hypothetical protein